MTIQQDNTLGFVFPGQGSQKVGMLSELAEAFPLVNEVFDEASEALSFNLSALIADGPQEELNLTQNAQPALLAASTAIWRIWHEKEGVSPAVLAGHSLGEWSALVASGVVAFADAIRLVRLRGEYMQSAVPVGVGAMAAIIGLADNLVEEACQNSAGEEVVVPVNFNSPGQVVIAGHVNAVNKAIEEAQALGAKRGMLLPVSAPFHTSLMKPAADQLAEHIEATHFGSPQIPVLQNVGVEASGDPAVIKSKIIEQIYSPVPWVATVDAMVAQGVQTLVECGPGRVLSGLNKRINKTLNLLPTDDCASFSKALEL